MEKDIAAVGTLVSNRNGLPKEFLKATGRKEFSYEIFWNTDDAKMILHNYVVKAKSAGLRNVPPLSTIEPMIAITPDDCKQNLQIYKVYDFTKGEADILTNKPNFTRVNQKAVAALYLFFSYVVDTSRVNASTVWSRSNN